MTPQTSPFLALGLHPLPCERMTLHGHLSQAPSIPVQRCLWGAVSLTQGSLIYIPNRTKGAHETTPAPTSPRNCMPMCTGRFFQRRAVIRFWKISMIRIRLSCAGHRRCLFTSLSTCPELCFIWSRSLWTAVCVGGFTKCIPDLSVTLRSATPR